MPPTNVCTTSGENNPITKKEKNNAKHREWYQANKEHAKAYAKEYALKNKESIRAYYQNKYCKTKEEYLLKAKKYRELNKEHCRKRSKAYRVKNSGKISEKAKQRYYKNHSIYLSTAKKWNERRRSIKNNLPATLTQEQWHQIKGYFDNKCAYCGKENKLDQEHFVPLSNGGEYTHNNIIPACRSCNSSKRNKDFFEWYPQQKFYSKNREQKILKFLNYKDGKQQLSLLI